MSKTQVFNYCGSEIRVVVHKGVLWWVLRDVCSVLGLSNIGRVIEHVKCNGLTCSKVNTGENTICQLYMVNESGLSDVLSQAGNDSVDYLKVVQFNRWVIENVIPTIKKQVELQERENELTTLNQNSNNELTTLNQNSNVDFQTVQFENYEIRIVNQNGEFWCVLRDVCQILNIEQPTRVAERLDSDEKADVNLMHVSSNGVSQLRKTLIINESGLYNVILRSDKPEAKKFKKWVTSEVLPTIRKNGVYMTPTKIEEFLSNPDTLIKVATEWKAEREKRIAAEKKIEEDKPKVSYFNNLIDHQNNLNFRDTAKELGITEKKFINWLLNNRLVYRDNSKILKPYSETVNAGFFVLKEWVHGNLTGVQTLITVKGRNRFHQLLKTKKNI
jgi:prophage antirepressor-like protein